MSNLPQAFPKYRVEAVDNLTHEAATHRFKVGFDIDRVKLSRYICQNVPRGFGIFYNSVSPGRRAAPLGNPFHDPSLVAPAGRDTRTAPAERVHSIRVVTARVIVPSGFC